MKKLAGFWITAGLTLGAALTAQADVLTFDINSYIERTAQAHKVVYLLPVAVIVVTVAIALWQRMMKK